jgi:hypothetical protein
MDQSSTQRTNLVYALLGLLLGFGVGLYNAIMRSPRKRRLLLSVLLLALLSPVLPLPYANAAPSTVNWNSVSAQPPTVTQRVKFDAVALPVKLSDGEVRITFDNINAEQTADWVVRVDGEDYAWFWENTMTLYGFYEKTNIVIVDRSGRQVVTFDIWGGQAFGVFAVYDGTGSRWITQRISIAAESKGDLDTAGYASLKLENISPAVTANWRVMLNGSAIGTFSGNNTRFPIGAKTTVTVVNGAGREMLRYDAWSRQVAHGYSNY